MRAKMATISLGAGRRASGVSRLAYHATLSCQSCGRVTRGRLGRPLAWHHSFTRSSDRKKSIVFHVKTMSRHQRLAGTAKWMTHGTGSGPAAWTAMSSGSRLCSQRDRTSPLRATGATIPGGPQRIPGGVRKVPAAAHDHAMLSRNARKRGRHQDLLAVRGEDQEPPLEEPLKRCDNIPGPQARRRGETGDGWRFARGDEVLIDRMPYLQVGIDHRSTSLGFGPAGWRPAMLRRGPPAAAADR